MNSVSITRTASCNLESSTAKNQVLKEGVEGYQDAVEYYTQMLPSLQEHEWNSQNTHLYRMGVRDLEFSVRAKLIQNAVRETVAAFNSWKEVRKSEEKPTGRFGDYITLSNQGYTIEENERGYGIKANIIPYNPVWWHLNIGSHQQKYIKKAINNGASFGSAQIFYNDGDPFVNITVSWDVEVHEPGDADYVIGVDLGEDTMYSLAVRDSVTDEVKEVTIQSGDEFRHHRDRLNARKNELQKQGDLLGVKETRNERSRYTDQMTHTAARRIVDVARDYLPCVIRLEDLTNYRDTAADPIHDWPFAELQEKISNKATAEGIPVEMVDPAYTSVTCRKCGNQDAEQRDGCDFVCVSCGYEVHADVNAAMNIAVTT